MTDIDLDSAIPYIKDRPATPLDLIKFARELLAKGEALAASVVLEDVFAFETARVDFEPYEDEKLKQWWRRAIDCYTERKDPDEHN